MSIHETMVIKRFIKNKNLKLEMSLLEFANFLSSKRMSLDDVLKEGEKDVGNKQLNN